MIELKNEITGIISDTHFPGHVDGALDFVLETGLAWGIKQWVHIGDVVDYHYISHHPNELGCLNPVEEYEKAKEEVQKWYKHFPNLHICIGNHDAIPVRQLASLGMPDMFTPTFNTLYETPSWTWAEEYKIYNNTLIDHGMGSGGMYGAKNTANKLGVSYIQGHTHAHGAQFDLPRPLYDAAALNVGCLMDKDKYFAAYGKKYKMPVSLGMGVACSDSEMYFIKYKG